MIGVILVFILGYFLGVITISCFAVRNYNKGFKDGCKRRRDEIVNSGLLPQR